MKLFNVIQAFGIFILSYSSEINIPQRPNTRDEHNCLMTKGFSWCEDLQSCIQIWETPCKDNYENCEDCLFKQHIENIACPFECDTTLINHPMIPSSSPSPSPCNPCPPPPSCSYPGPDCRRLPPDINNCGCVYECGEIDCDSPLPNHQSSPCPIEQIDCTNEYVCPKITEITHCSKGGIDGHTTYQLSVIVQPDRQVGNIYALFGDKFNHDMYFPPAYHIDGPFNSNIGGISPSIISIFPDAFYDSWITIGITDGNLDDKLSTIGIDFNEWTETKSITTSNGAVFVMNPNDFVSTNEYILAQITIPNDRIDVFTVNVQGKKINNEIWKEYGINFVLNPSKLMQSTIPNNCSLWFDGCNLCQVNNGRLGRCTLNTCLTDEESECRVYDQSGH